MKPSLSCSAARSCSQPRPPPSQLVAPFHATYGPGPLPALRSCRARRTQAASTSGTHQQQQTKPRQDQQSPHSSPNSLPIDDGPSTSGSAASSSYESAPEGSSGDNTSEPRAPWLVQTLQRFKAPQWLVSLVSRYLVPHPSARTAPLARALWISVGFLMVAFGRELLFPTPRVVAREVLYSDFVTLLDGGRVRAARLEAGTSKLYFDIRMSQQQQQQAQQQAAEAVGTAAAAVVGVEAAEAAAGVVTGRSSPPGTTPVAVSAAAAATSTGPVRQRFQKQFYIKLADKQDAVLLAKLLQAGVEYSVLRASFQSAAAQAFLTAVALWVPLLPMLWLLRRIIDQRQGTSRAKKANNTANTPSTTFADVAGVDAAKAELLEVVSVMRQTKAAYSKLKVKMPSGVLLCGPPGTGKTLLAKAVAGEAGVPFFAVSASEFVELFVGRGAARIRELFAEARKAAPCVVFIDELDGVGSRRGMGYNDERDQTLNQLLTELDGFDGRAGVLFLAATNRIDVLDPALLRPGRISRKVVVPLPDAAGRAQILSVHLRGVPLEAGIEPATACVAVAAATEGFSGAELANVVNEASLLAARESREEVGLRDLLAGAQRTKFGVNGRSGANAFGGALTQRLQSWLADAAVAASERRPVKVGTGSG